MLCGESRAKQLTTAVEKLNIRTTQTQGAGGLSPKNEKTWLCIVHIKGTNEVY